MAFKNTRDGVKFIEDPEDEVARLAQAPVGSINHTLSTLPVNIRGNIQDLIIELPKETFHDHTVIVVPVESYKLTEAERNAPLPHRRYRATWRCAVIASNHPSYPVAGHGLSLGEDRLVRGTLHTITIPAAPAQDADA